MITVDWLLKIISLIIDGIMTLKHLSDTPFEKSRLFYQNGFFPPDRTRSSIVRSQPTCLINENEADKVLDLLEQELTRRKCIKGRNVHQPLLRKDNDAGEWMRHWWLSRGDKPRRERGGAQLTLCVCNDIRRNCVINLFIRSCANHFEIGFIIVRWGINRCIYDRSCFRSSS